MGKLKHLGENLSQCYFVHHKSPTESPGIELDHPQLNAGDKLPEPRYSLHCLSYHMLWSSSGTVCYVSALNSPSVSVVFKFSPSAFVHTLPLLIPHSWKYWGADKSLARPGRKQATATKLELLQATQKKFRTLSFQPGLRGSSDLHVRRKMSTFQLFFQLDRAKDLSAPLLCPSFKFVCHLKAVS